MICEKCGARNQENVFYCENCGKPNESKEEKIEKKQCQICHRGHGINAKYCATYGYDIEKWIKERNKFEQEKSEAIKKSERKEGISLLLLMAWFVIAVFSFASFFRTSIGWTTGLIEAANIAFSVFCILETNAYFNKRDDYWDGIWQRRTDKLKAL